jgi:hypothetical protein
VKGSNQQGNLLKSYVWEGFIARLQLRKRKRKRRGHKKNRLPVFRQPVFPVTVEGVQTARLLGSASATWRGRLFHHFTRLVFDCLYSLVGFFLCLVANCLYSLAGLFLCLVSNCLCSTLSLVLSSANCAVFFLASSTGAGGVSSRQRYSARTDQSCNAQSGQEFFQILTVHTILLFWILERLGTYR